MTGWSKNLVSLLHTKFYDSPTLLEEIKTEIDSIVISYLSQSLYKHQERLLINTQSGCW